MSGEEYKKSSSIVPCVSGSVSGQITNWFENTVSSFLENYPPDIIFLAAVSGGADSIAMLTALCAFVPKERLYCLHVEHGIRPPEESKGDAEFVRDYCQKLGIECLIVSIPQGKISSFARRKGTGIEAAARFFRRRFFFREAKRLGENSRILIAHTKDDLLETALMRVLRGCGPAGLAAMSSEKRAERKEKREKSSEQCSGNKEQRIILRPLLSVSHEDVLRYLKAKGVLWREDSTNADDKYLRNKIRLRLVPLLNETFPSWKTGVSRMAETQAFAADFIKEEAKKRISWNFEHSKFSSIGRAGSCQSISTNREKFFSQPLIIREESLFLAIDKILKGKKIIKPVKRSVIRRFCGGKVNAADLGPVKIIIEKDRIILSRKRKEFFESGVSLLI